MTAIKKYTRLEASGFWRESTESEQIEVLITFGKTSIILSDYKENPLTHWSLAAIKLISRSQAEAIFSTDLENGETLSISDANMIHSFLLFINKDEKKLESKNGVYYIITASLVIFFTLFILFLPSKIRSLTESVISQAHEVQLIKSYISEHLKTYGSTCSSAQADKILNSIVSFVQNDTSTLSIRIVRSQKMNVLHLPGGSILISNDFLKDASNERSLVEILEQELLRASERRPLKTLINEQNLFLLIKFILGFESEFSVTKVNSFLVPTKTFPIDKNSQLDDFSWVALKNICLN